jgi:hypothetical protein
MARAIKQSGKPFYYVLTRCMAGERRISDGQLLLDRLGGRAGAPLHFRVDYQDAIAKSLGVTEFRRNSAAAQEILSLWKWLAEHLGLPEERTSDEEG